LLASITWKEYTDLHSHWHEELNKKWEKYSYVIASTGARTALTSIHPTIDKHIRLGGIDLGPEGGSGGGLRHFIAR